MRTSSTNKTAGVRLFLAGIVVPDAGRRRSPAERFDLVVGLYLEALQAHPTFARTFLIEVYAAGPAALERRLGVQALFVDLVAKALRAPANERFAVEALVASITFLVTNCIAADHVDELTALRPRLVELLARICPWTVAR
jgi:hypothetical protein